MSRLKRSGLTLSTEHTAIGISPNFFIDLTECVRTLRASKGTPSSRLKDSGIDKTIKKYTGLFTTSHFRDDLGFNTFMPEISINHPFITSLRQADIVPKFATSGLTELKAVGSDLIGKIDIKKGMVYGAYAEIEHPIGLSEPAIFVEKLGYTNEMIAAIILHEVGHLFTHYQFIIHTVTGTAAIHSAAKYILGADSVDLRTDRIKHVLEEYNILDRDVALKNLTALSDTTDILRNVTTVLCTSSQLPRYNEAGVFLYDLRMAEQMADEFATRCGAGAHNGAALEHHMKLEGGKAGVLRRVAHQTMDVAVIGNLTAGLVFGGTSIVAAVVLPLTIATAVIAAIGGVMALVTGTALGLLYRSATKTANPYLRRYDNDSDRFNHIKLITVDMLKDKSLPNDVKKKLIKDVAELERQSKEWKRYQPIMSRLVDIIDDTRKYGKAEQKQMQQLLTMLHNPLFVAAAKIQTGV